MARARVLAASRVLLFALALIPVLLPLAARSATIHVPGDAPTIQAGIDAAAPGDSVLVAPGTYSGPGNTDLDFGGKDLVLRSEGGAAVTAIDLNHAGRGFFFTHRETGALLVDGFTVENGLVDSDGGAVLCNFSSPAFANCVFTGNAGDSGGAMWLYASSPVVTDCTFSGNFGGGNSEAAGHGGAIWADRYSSPTLTRCAFIDNSASRRGGAVWIGVGAPVLTDCTFTGNSTMSMGGGVMCYGGSSHAAFVRCTFSGNTTTSAGGGVACLYTSPSFTGCTFTGNVGGSRGGGMWLSGSFPTIDGCVFDRNSAVAGGGLLCFASGPAIASSTFHANGAGAGGGGGLYLGSLFGASTAVISRTIIASGPRGEAVLCEPGSSAVLSCADVFGNAGGDWVGCLAGQSGTNGNFSADPLFCDAAGGDLTLDAGSPCAPEHSPSGCDLVGALPVGCGTTAIASDAAPAAAGALRVVPNPLATGGVIRWVSERPGPATLGLYDSLGRLVLARDLGATGAGRQEIAWERLAGASKLPAGVYFLRLEGGLGPARATRVVVTR